MIESIIAGISLCTRCCFSIGMFLVGIKECFSYVFWGGAPLQALYPASTMLLFVMYISIIFYERPLNFVGHCIHVVAFLSVLILPIYDIDTFFYSAFISELIVLAMNVYKYGGDDDIDVDL